MAGKNPLLNASLILLSFALSLLATELFFHALETWNNRKAESAKLRMLNIWKVAEGPFIHDKDTLISFKNNISHDGYIIYPGFISNQLKTYEYSTNDIGFRRGKPIDIGSSEKRIALLGDSITFGIAVKENQTFSYLLDETLRNDSGGEYSAVNLGIPGINTWQEYAILKKWGEKLNIKIVHLQICINDIDPPLVISEELRGFPKNGTAEDNIVSENERLISDSLRMEVYEPWRKRNERLIEAESRNAVFAFIKKFRLGRFVLSRLVSSGIVSPFVLESRRTIHKLWFNETFIPIYLISMWCKERGIEFLFTYIPANNQLGNDKTKIAFPQSFLASWSKSKGLNFADAGNYLSKSGGEALYLNIKGDVHFNQKGHKIFTAYLYNKIENIIKPQIN